eukprot:2130434-Amphidinium_carterae.2
MSELQQELMELDSLSTPRMKIDTPDFGAISMNLKPTSVPMSSTRSPQRNSFAAPVSTPPGLHGVPTYPMTPAAHPQSYSPVPPLNFSQCAGAGPQRDDIDLDMDHLDQVMTTMMETMVMAMIVDSYALYGVTYVMEKYIQMKNSAIVLSAKRKRFI